MKTIRTSLEIRQTLVQIAEKAGRPHYELAVVRDVIRAFQTGADHPLKSAVLGGVAPRPVKPKSAKLEKLIEFCAPAGMKHILARQSGVHFSHLCMVLRGDSELHDWVYGALVAAFDRAETEFTRRALTLKTNTHGTWACYSKMGCRCVECSGAAQIKYLAKKYGKAA